MNFVLLSILSFLLSSIHAQQSANEKGKLPNEFFLQFLEQKYNYQTDDFLILVSVKEQKLFLYKNKELLESYVISTSKYGIGQAAGSYKTPLGAHIIKSKIGDGAASGSVFRGRVFTGKIADVVHEAVATDDDFVTTRILWLQGLSKGFNQGDGIDSYKRYIYIHGTHEEGLLGKKASHGCVRMSNKEVIELYNKVPEGTFVYILDAENRPAPVDDINLKVFK
ncbi:MAG: L,D-transpeptidase [Chitinophagaceae bacterium]|nr:MAG: L,D-transpeptidase [Chitinophagaceae bacterium]